MIFRKKKIGIAFGGGAARGLAHIGIIKVLNELNFKPTVIAGTSMGSIVGAMYACGKFRNAKDILQNIICLLDTEEFADLGFQIYEKKKKITSTAHLIENIHTTLRKMIYYKRLYTSKFIIDSFKLEKVISRIVPNINIEDMPVKFLVVALDVVNRRKVVIEKGSLIKALTASSALPGIFSPVRMGQYSLLDGGWIEQVPVPTLYEEKVDKIIGLHVTQHPLSDKPKLENGLDYISYTNAIVSQRLIQCQLEKADLVINPILRNVHWYEFNKYKYFFEKGEKIARDMIPQISKIIK